MQVGLTGPIHGTVKNDLDKKINETHYNEHYALRADCSVASLTHIPVRMRHGIPQRQTGT